MVHPVQRPAGVQSPAFPLKLRIVRFQDAAADVVAAGPAHGEECFSLDAVNLPPHQVDHRGADLLYLTAAPFLYRVLCQQIIVFMVAGDEQGGERLLLQPIQPVPLIGAAVPDASEVSGDDNTVLFGQLGLLVEDVFFETGEIAVCIACYEDCHNALAFHSYLSTDAVRFLHPYP